MTPSLNIFKILPPLEILSFLNKYNQYHCFLHNFKVMLLLISMKQNVPNLRWGVTNTVWYLQTVYMQFLQDFSYRQYK